MRALLAASSATAAVVVAAVLGTTAVAFGLTMTDAHVAVRASSTAGPARIQGVGLASNGPALLTNVRITGNAGKAAARDGWIQGGGIFDGHVFRRPTPALTLRGSTVTGNAVSGATGVSVKGGGLNTPDQCAGC